MFLAQYNETKLIGICNSPFRSICNLTRPNKKVMTRRSDMCMTCSQLMNLASLNLPKGSAVLQKAQVNVKCDIASLGSVLEVLRNHCQQAKDAGEFYTDQKGALYFLSPLTVGLFRICDEKADEQARFIRPETRAPKKMEGLGLHF